MALDVIQKNLLKSIADLEEIPEGAYNIRSNGSLAGRHTTANIDIVTKTDKPGIDIIIKAGTKNERVDIPVLLTETGLDDLVYNDFYIGEDADVLIVAGCGIHNAGGLKSEHDGIHAFHLAKGAKLKYVEKHYGEGEGTGERILNPTTEIEMAKDSYMEMESTQIGGVDSTVRVTLSFPQPFLQNSYHKNGKKYPFRIYPKQHYEHDRPEFCRHSRYNRYLPPDVLPFL